MALVTKNGASVQLINRQAPKAVRKFGELEINEQTHTLALVNGQLQVVAKRNLKEVK